MSFLFGSLGFGNRESEIVKALRMQAADSGVTEFGLSLVAAA